MASNHHHHCNNHHHTTTPPHSCCCTTTTNPPPPPPPSPIDPLLQALASQILLHQSPQLHKKQHPNQNHTVIISSLLTRIEALESSLHRVSSNPCRGQKHRSSSIRDAAARTIQTGFRAFLVRRSRTLRNLKDLAVIKSAFIELESSVSRRTSVDAVAVYRKAMNLLRELDSIQGGDPMIRDGKKSITKDLIRFLDLIDRFSAEMSVYSTKATMNVKHVQNIGKKHRDVETNYRGLRGRDQRETMDKLRDRIQNIEGYDRVSDNDDDEGSSDDDQIARASNYGKNGGFQIRKNGQTLKKFGVQSSLKKCVSFADDGNIAQVLVSKNMAPKFDYNQRERAESKDDVEEIGSFSKEAEADEDEETQIESGGSDQTSDSEETPRMGLEAEEDHEISEHYHAKNGNFTFSAPEPVKMESRAEDTLYERIRKMEERLMSKKS